MAEGRVVARIPSVKVTVGGETHTGWLPRNAAQPRPSPVREVEVRIEITDLGGGFELLYEATDGSGWSDTWHPTLEEAMEMAEEDFGVQRSDWHAADGTVQIWGFPVTTVPQHTAQPLADIVASRPPWLRTRLSTILIWPTIQGDWTAILHYAHYTTAQPGETVPPGINVTYPHDTHHPVAVVGADVTAGLQAQVRDLERTGEVGNLTVKRVAAPPWTPGGPPSPGWTICTHSGSEVERRIGQAV